MVFFLKKIRIKKKYTKDLFILFVVSVILVSWGKKLEATPLYGPVPPNGVNVGQPPNGGYDLPQTPNQAVPSLNGPGVNGPPTQNAPQSGASPSTSNPSLGPASGQSPAPGSPQGQAVAGSSSGPDQGPSSAPTFMNGALPNTSNPFLPNNVSPGLVSGPIENSYLQNGVPQLAAPLMSVVYRPFGLVYFQPNPFQVAPQGTVSLTGDFETDTNINFSPTNPETGSFYSITPAVMYSNFNDYGYLSLLASASYFQYDTGNIPPYFDEMGGLSVGTYLGTRIFVGAQDFAMSGSTPLMNGQPLAFFNGINPFYENMADAEVGIALTPKLSFVQGASDIYSDYQSFGAGFSNIQSLIDSLNFMDKNYFLSASYIYQQEFASDFPGFISNGWMGTAMRTLSPTSSIGVGGSFMDFLYQNLPSLNFTMYSGYGIFTHHLTRSLSFSAMGGWNMVVLQDGQSFQSPMGDLNLGYSGSRMGLGINLGYFMENNNTYGIETGPVNSAMALGYFDYRLGAKTNFTSSVGYSYYQFMALAPYSNNFFNNLQNNVSYDGGFLEQSDILTYTPLTWLSTSLAYNFIDFSTNIPNETIIDNQFIALISFFWNFK